MEHNKLCCRELSDGKQCDYLDFVYRLTNPTHHPGPEADSGKMKE